ncbi:hypothetical protein BX666DRAFT_1863517 [Dichotomocladium elegans]|nr:hypothetical protein BX666DRAFT_1863517 [Dichotomocladium elegans]
MARRALDLFLDSRIAEAEAILQPQLCQTSLYYAHGRALLLTIKSVMTFQPEDFEAAYDALKHTVNLSNALIRKGQGGNWFLEGLQSWVKGGLTRERLEAMKPVYRHAELVHAEAHLLKAMVCIIHDESLISFLREGLHIRQSYITYTALEKYVLETDLEPDQHFKSGVLFGMGCFKVMLSLLPKTVLRLVEFIGFSGDRPQGIRLLESCGGWDVYKKTGVAPDPQGPEEGLRRQFADMVLIAYHSVLAKLIPISDEDDEFSAEVLRYNLRLYPNGVLFLFFHGHQFFCQAKLDEANMEYNRAIEAQKDWVQLQHICYWESGLISVIQADWQASARIYDILYNDSNWSKAVYTYFKGVSLFMLAQQSSGDKQKSLLADARAMMKKVPGFRQKIAGKSIPLEKFVARKASKFLDQGGSLMFPDLEVLNAFGACEYTPTHLLRANIQRIDDELERSNSKSADDICLGNYLRALMLRLLYIRSNAENERAKLRDDHHQSLNIVFTQAKNVLLDHYVYYFAQYEGARMFILEGDYDAAESCINVILKASEKGNYNIGAGPKAKSKYSLENSLLFKCHSCQSELQTLRSAEKSRRSNHDS